MGVETCERVDAKGHRCGGEIEDGVCGKCGRPVQKVPLLAEAVGTSTQSRGTGTQARGTGTQGRGTGTQGQGRGGGRSSRRQSSGSTTSRRQSLGGGLVSLPPVPSQDPMKLVIADPQVPVNKRHCPHCRARVNRMKGFCNNCGKEYDFRPGLNAGDLVGGKYEIKGPIGLGGMGWIYLAEDAVLKRWVVLKGVLNAEDPEAAAAAVAERRFLAAVKDARIVQIYDFVPHANQGYMVLEYVGGRTVDDIRADGDVVDVFDDQGQPVRAGVLRSDLTPAERAMTVQVKRFGTLPPEVAISYVLAVLPAFAYLHAQGYTHNDMKPDNVMVEGDAVKLIDLGAMRRIDDEGGAIFGTDGFFAPEAEDGPVAVSDLYSVGRTLAVLLMDFLYKVQAERDATTRRLTTRRLIVSGYKRALPGPAEQPVLAANDSLYRFLLRATHEDPDQRFQSADEMEGQLFGILREIVAEQTRSPKPAESRVFFADGLVDGADREGASAPLVRTLPALRIDPGDVAAADVLGLAAVVDAAQRVEELRKIVAKPKKKATVEGRLRLADALVARGLAETVPDAHLVPRPYDPTGSGDEPGDKAVRTFAEALSVLDEILAANEFEWRAHWYAGRALLASGRAREAIGRFDRVYFEMPGELAPRLALGVACEAAGDLRAAAAHYARVTLVDPGYASASFGLARCLKAAGDTAGAAAALGAVPPAHALYTQARISLAHALIEGDHARHPEFLPRAGETIAAVTAKDGSVERLSARLFATAVELIEEGGRKEDSRQTLMGRPLTGRAMREAAEQAFLASARRAGTTHEKDLWIDMAQRIRPATLF